MWKSDLPSEIIAGTTIEWVDEATTAGIDETISSPDWTLEYYLRTNTSSEGHTATGTQYSESTGWQFTITCLLYTSPSPRDATLSRMPSSA